MSQIEFATTPNTHAELNGHWDRAFVDVGPCKHRHLQIQFQNGPVEEVGVNGVQLLDVLEIAIRRYQMLNKSFPCRENSMVITKLQEAAMWDRERTAQRVTQGVEGQDKPHR